MSLLQKVAPPALVLVSVLFSELSDSLWYQKRNAGIIMDTFFLYFPEMQGFSGKNVGSLFLSSVISGPFIWAVSVYSIYSITLLSGEECYCIQTNSQ